MPDQVSCREGTPAISVIVPTFRRRDSVRRLLDALNRQTLPLDRFEVVVSIDGSEDGTHEMVTCYQAPYRLISVWRPNRGRASACNIGVAQSRGTLLVFLDDDMEPEPDCLQAHYAAHATDARVGVLGAIPVVVTPSSPPVVVYKRAVFDGAMSAMSRPDFTFQLRDFYSGHFSIRRSDFLAVGGFEERFVVYGNEDHELSLRLKRAGIHLAYEPAAVAHQHYLKDFRGLAKDTVEKGRTAVILASIHPDTYGDLKLKTYFEGGRCRRAARSTLLTLSRLCPWTPKLLVLVTVMIERLRAPWLHAYYRLILGYFYWLGATSEMRANRRRGTGVMRLSRLPTGRRA